MTKPTLYLDGNAVRVIREQLGLSGRELAKAAAISPSAISYLETGKRNARPVVIHSIARALGVHPDRISTLVELDDRASA